MENLNLEKRNAHRPGAGRPLDDRLKIEVDIRRRVASGKLKPGERLEPRAEAARRLGCSVLTVQRAYAALEREGTLACGRRRRDGTAVADSPGCLSRFLVIAEANSEGPLALARAVQTAADIIASKRGLHFDFIMRNRESPDSPQLTLALDDARSGHYAGIFVPTPFRQSDYHDPSLDIPGVPTGAYSNERRDAQATRLALLSERGGKGDFWRKAIDDLYAQGVRRPAVIAPISYATTESTVRKIFHREGMDIPPHFFHTSNQIGDNIPELRRIVSWLFDGASGVRADALVLGDDNFVQPAEEALIETLGEYGARGITLVALGNKPGLPQVRLPFRWHGVDIEATLSAFVDWCEAIRAGRRRRAPHVVKF